VSIAWNVDSFSTKLFEVQLVTINYDLLLLLDVKEK